MLFKNVCFICSQASSFLCQLIEAMTDKTWRWRYITVYYVIYLQSGLFTETCLTESAQDSSRSSQIFRFHSQNRPVITTAHWCPYSTTGPHVALRPARPCFRAEVERPLSLAGDINAVKYRPHKWSENDPLLWEEQREEDQLLRSQAFTDAPVAGLTTLQRPYSLIKCIIHYSPSPMIYGDFKSARAHIKTSNKNHQEKPLHSNCSIKMIPSQSFLLSNTVYSTWMHIFPLLFFS